MKFLTKRFLIGSFASEVEWFPAHWSVFTWQRQNEILIPYLEAMGDRYEAHNRRVKEVVPEDRLLVWNIKDGWEPLCKFLGKPVPDAPIPVHTRKSYLELIDLSTTTKLETLSSSKSTSWKAKWGRRLSGI